MTWTAPRPPAFADGPLVGADRPILEAFLAWQRSTLLNIGARPYRRAVGAAGVTTVEPLAARAGSAPGGGGAHLVPAARDRCADDLDPELAREDFARFREEPAGRRRCCSDGLRRHLHRERGDLSAAAGVRPHDRRVRPTQRARRPATRGARRNDRALIIPGQQARVLLTVRRASAVRPGADLPADCWPSNVPRRNRETA